MPVYSGDLILNFFFCFIKKPLFPNCLSLQSVPPEWILRSHQGNVLKAVIVSLLGIPGYFLSLIMAHQNLLKSHSTFPLIPCFNFLVSPLNFVIIPFGLLIWLFPLPSPAYCHLLPHAADDLFLLITRWTFSLEWFLKIASLLIINSLQIFGNDLFWSCRL